MPMSFAICRLSFVVCRLSFVILIELRSRGALDLMGDPRGRITGGASEMGRAEESREKSEEGKREVMTGGANKAVKAAKKGARRSE